MQQRGQGNEGACRAPSWVLLMAPCKDRGDLLLLLFLLLLLRLHAGAPRRTFCGTRHNSPRKDRAGRPQFAHAQKGVDLVVLTEEGEAEGEVQRKAFVAA